MQAPTGLSATAVSSSQINLTWTDNSLAEDGYRIEQSPVDNLHFLRNCGHWSECNLLQCYRSHCRDTSITTECELTMRLRLPHIVVRKTPPLFPVFPSRHQGSRSPPFCQARSLSPGLTTLTMKRVSRFNGKGLRERIPIDNNGSQCNTVQRHYCYRWYFVLLPGFCHQLRWRLCLFERSVWHYSSGKADRCYCNGSVIKSNQPYLD